LGEVCPDKVDQLLSSAGMYWDNSAEFGLWIVNDEGRGFSFNEFTECLLTQADTAYDLLPHLTVLLAERCDRIPELAEMAAWIKRNDPAAVAYSVPSVRENDQVLRHWLIDNCIPILSNQSLALWLVGEVAPDKVDLFRRAVFEAEHGKSGSDYTIRFAFLAYQNGVLRPIVEKLLEFFPNRISHKVLAKQLSGNESNEGRIEPEISYNEFCCAFSNRYWPLPLIRWGKISKIIRKILDVQQQSRFNLVLLSLLNPKERP